MACWRGMRHKQLQQRQTSLKESGMTSTWVPLPIWFKGDNWLKKCSAERSTTLQSWSTSRLRNRSPRQRTSTLHGKDLRSTTANVRQGWWMLSVGCWEPKILGFHSWNCSQCPGPLWSWNHQNNRSAGMDIPSHSNTNTHLTDLEILS